MTDIATAKHPSEHFWTRVRTALGGMRPLRQERAPAYGQAAIARSIGIKPRLGPRIDEELALGWRLAAARQVSLSLLVIEIDRFAEYFTSYGRAATDDCLLEVLGAIKAALPREADTCLRLGQAGFVLVLPDLPVLMARATAAKIADAVKALALAHKESHAGIVTISQGLAVTNPQGNYDRRFFEAAAEALKKGQRKGMARVEGVDLRPTQKRRKAS